MCAFNNAIIKSVTATPHMSWFEHESRSGHEMRFRHKLTSVGASLATLKNWRSPLRAQRVHAYACVCVSVCACVHVCACVFVRVYVCSRVSVFLCVCMCMCALVCLHTRVSVCMCVRMRVCVCVRAHVCMCAGTPVCVCVSCCPTDAAVVCMALCWNSLC